MSKFVSFQASGWRLLYAMNRKCLNLFHSRLLDEDYHISWTDGCCIHPWDDIYGRCVLTGRLYSLEHISELQPTAAGAPPSMCCQGIWYSFFRNHVWLWKIPAVACVKYFDQFDLQLQSDAEVSVSPIFQILLTHLVIFIHFGFQTRDIDDNGDGGHDRFELSMEIPLADSEEVYGLKLMLFFQVDLMVRKFFCTQNSEFTLFFN